VKRKLINEADISKQTKDENIILLYCGYQDILKSQNATLSIIDTGRYSYLVLHQHILLRNCDDTMLLSWGSQQIVLELIEQAIGLTPSYAAIYSQKNEKDQRSFRYRALNFIADVKRKLINEADCISA
jgi:hypothetical protein